MFSPLNSAIVSAAYAAKIGKLCLGHVSSFAVFSYYFSERDIYIVGVHENKIAQDIDDMFYRLEKDIEEFLKSKSEYILRTLDHYADIAKYVPKPKQYVDGESFRILWHDRRLKVVQGKRNAVASDESYITLKVRDTTDLELKKKTMDKWIKNTVKKYYLQYAKVFILSFRSMALPSRNCVLEI